MMAKYIEKIMQTKGRPMNEEYITKSEAIEAACNAVELFPSEYHEIENAINRIAADVALVRRERWEKRGSKWQCTGCKVLMSIDGTPQENLLYYCPNCGAKMGKEVADETCIYQPYAE